jgi:hypothetical protein
MSAAWYESIDPAKAEALVRKAAPLRYNSVEARGVVLALTDARNVLYAARADLEGQIRQEKENLRTSHSSGPWIGTMEFNIARWTRGIKFISEVLIPDLDTRINVAGERAQGQGLAAEKLLSLVAQHIEFMGVDNAL